MPLNLYKLAFHIVCLTTLALCVTHTPSADVVYAEDDATQSSKSASSKTESPKPVVKNRDCGEIFDEYQHKLESLAQKCDELKMPLEAQVTRSFLYQEKPDFFVVPLLPDKVAQSKLPDDASSTQQKWFDALNRLRTKYAEETYAVAERYAKQKRGYDVVACILTTLFINPDHPKARSYFGYTQVDGYWRTPWEVRQINDGLVKTDDFGWIPKEHLEKYKEGMRYHNGKWMTIDDEAEQMHNSSDGWRIESEHFSVLSRVSLERGVEVSRLLESYYQAWSRLFYRFIATGNQWNAMLYSKSEIVSKRHKVILYRNRSEYLRELRRHDNNVSQSVGGYFPSMRCIFVYEPAEDDEFELFPLLTHEATHQLFSECNLLTRTRGKNAGVTFAQNANYWAIEAIAIYAETFQVNKNRTTAYLGGYKDVFRIQCAMESLFEDDSYIPLREYAGMSMSAFQKHKDLPLLYSEAAGLAFFFMHYRDGVYRDPFVNYLYMIYQETDSYNTLEQALGKTFGDIDKEYKAFMELKRGSQRIQGTSR
ncbi:MAG: hypothetical protein Q4G03_08110 [Planctomycetia bacterium]|nr:hypothetical protein [Planctomycetia bacterium]